MAIYLDSAELAEAQRALALGFVHGVTTNPTLIARSGRPGPDVLADLLHLTGGPVFYQLTAGTEAARVEQAHAIFDLAPTRLIIKIPATTANYALAARLIAEGVACCMTAVSSPAQAYLAGEIGAAYIAPYVNRLTRHLGDGPALVRQMAAVLAGTPTRILAASLKSPEEVVAAVTAGAHDVTTTLDVLLAMGEHPLSQDAIAAFDRAAAGAAQE